LLGESLGAIQALALAASASGGSRPAALAGLVLSGPELAPRQTTPAPQGTPFWRQAVPYLRYVLYGLCLSRWPVVDMTGREELVTRRPEQAEFSKRDPLRNNRLSIQTLIEAYRLICSAYRLARAVRLPTLILQAEADLVTDPAAAQRLRDALAGPDRELVYFRDARHGLFYDPDTPRVLATIVDWMGRYAPPGTEP
jgi:alpha-beta hydrolase superfamily lysophospholipase